MNREVVLTIRLYTETDHAPNTHWRNHLIPMLKAYWGDGTDWNRDEAAYLRGIFEFTDNIQTADIVALPLAWNYYPAHNKIERAVKLADRAAVEGKPILVWSDGDYGARLPFGNALLFEYDIARSKRHDAEKNIRRYARSPFTRDYPAQFLNGSIAVREKGAKPRVGFCGFAKLGENPLPIRARNVLRQLESRLKTVYFEPPSLGLPVNLRADVLRRLAANPHIETDFILRDNYGGKQTDQRTVEEFVHNMRDTDYTVCVRGWGNYSIRFCETLSMGRIPIFLDTDCALPYDFKLNWRDCCVWVDESELEHVAEKVADFHARISPSDFVALQHECRRIWQDYLTPQTYFGQFDAHLRHAGVIEGQWA